ncbi:MAG TPA: aminotransferase class IV [Thermodesulfovibrionales bacterium]|nr:aminotransferase class IV [Thermodesulfovibrionales bacterium]
MQIFLDDRLVPEQDAVVSVFDHGFLYGDGVYETMRAYDGRVFLLGRHIERLGRSAALIKMQTPEPQIIRDAVYAAVEANGLKDAYIRVTVSRGKGAIGLDPSLCPRPTFIVIAEEFRGYPGIFYEHGVRLIIAATRRNLIEALNPKIKSLNFLNNILAKMEAKERGAHEAIMLNAQGYIAEGTVCNIFFVKEGVLCTPAAEVGVLEGITRELVVTLAGKEGIAVNEGRFLPEDILTASEVFFTNTTSEIMPVSQVEQVNYPVGETTRKLSTLYKEEVRKNLAS